MSDLAKVPVTRISAVRWARAIAADSNAVYLDTETTGLGPDAEIVDIGIVAGDGRVLMDSLVRPLRPIPAEATAVHGITDSMVLDAYTWEQVCPVVADHLSGKTVVIYNAQYDTQILKQVTEATGFPLKLLNTRAECAMLAFSDFDGTPGRYPGQRKWHKLDVAAERFGIAPGGHRALADAVTCRSVVLAMAAHAIDEPVAPAAQPSLFDIQNPDRFAR